MSIYTKHLSNTPQSEPLPGRESEMMKNAAGGFTFSIDDWTRLERFLILGTEGGTYYVGEAKLTREGAAGVLRCIKEDGVRVVNRIVEVSDLNLAPKNDPSIFALALAAKNGDEATRSLAYKSMHKVCRTGTHLFQFVEAINDLGGWGRGARRAVGEWYIKKNPERLAFQLVKYRQRNGWTHRDLLRLAHPKPTDDAHRDLLAYAVGKSEPTLEMPHIVGAYETAKNATLLETVGLIHRHGLPRECVNTEYLNDPKILDALLESMPPHALLRNLGNLTKAGVLTPFSSGTELVKELLSDEAQLKKARVHPMAVYLALTQYASGQGFRGSGTWTPVASIIDALNEAFYGTMGNVTPTGKKLLLALDISGSMVPGYSGVYNPYESPAAKAAAMLLIAVNTETQYEIIGVNTAITPFTLSPKTRLDVAVNNVIAACGGGTNLALPYQHLVHKKYDVDGVILYTDNETWAGAKHASTVLEEYRTFVGHDVKNVVASMTATGHSVGDPMDMNTLQCVGLDASLPQTISAFVRGEF